MEESSFVVFFLFEHRSHPFTLISGLFQASFSFIYFAFSPTMHSLITIFVIYPLPTSTEECFSTIPQRLNHLSRLKHLSRTQSSFRDSNISQGHNQLLEGSYVKTKSSPRGSIIFRDSTISQGHNKLPGASSSVKTKPSL